MNVTVILCTYNRCDSLRRALESVAASDMPTGIEWEVLVVDNNSKDQTRAVTEEFVQRFPGRFRYLFEGRQGKSFALNSGIREARGDVLVFTDDDVVVEPIWLQNLTRPLADGPFAGSGGRILPEPGFSPPAWLALEGPLSMIGALCAYCNPGDAPGDLRQPPYGANMAFRREMFAKYGDFRLDLGPSPNNELRSEDTEFAGRLMAAGERLRYAPDAIVYHEIHASRIRREFFLAWWYDFGRGTIRSARRNLSAYETLKIIARTALTASQWMISADPCRRFYCKCRVWFAAGKLVEAWR